MTISQELIANGFTVNPNNIHSLPGLEFSRGYCGEKTIAFGYQIRVIEELIYIIKDHVTPRKDTTFVDFSHSVVRTHTTLSGLLNDELLTRETQSLPAGIWGD